MNFINESGSLLEALTQSSTIIDNVNDGFNIKTKESLRDIVTIFDIKVEESIKQSLNNTSTSYPILGEETCNKLSINSGDTFWALDPIDGTVNFAMGLQYFCISLGLVKKTDNSYDFLTGGLILPKTKEIFFCEGDEASFLDGKKLSKQDTSIDSSLISGCFSNYEKNIEKKNRQFKLFGEIDKNSRGAIRMGSAAIQVAYTATNRISATYGIASPIWDVAGALAIAKLAGCEILLKPIDGTTRVNFIVGGKTVVHQIKELIDSEDLW